MTIALPGLLIGRPTTAKVDCGSCRKCCIGHQLIVLVETDSLADYQCHEFAPGQWAVDRNAGGDCIYLGPDGCTIWGRHPAVCRTFDCAAFVERMDQGAFDGLGPRLDNDVIREGRKRLRRRLRGEVVR
jgi:Fe-S-cluster containining protein